MSIRGITNTANSLSFYTRLQEVTANNVANANTDAFKADRLTGWQLPGGDHPVPVERTDLKQGTFRETSRPLDLSLDGPGFFVVRTPQGERLTRGGSLRLDQAGRLTNAEGDPLLGVGGPIVLRGTEVVVHGDGTVWVDGAAAGQLRVETVDDPTTLLKEGFGRYVPSTRPKPVPENSARVRQGAIEEANLDPLLSMVDLVTIQRAFSANVDALRVMDSVLGVVTSEVGKV